LQSLALLFDPSRRFETEQHIASELQSGPEKLHKV